MTNIFEIYLGTFNRLNHLLLINEFGQTNNTFLENLTVYR